MTDTPHSIKDIAIAGCTSERGIRLWEEKGLFGEVARTSGDIRRFTADQMAMARIIAAASFGGWKLDEIFNMLSEWGPDVREAILDRLTLQLQVGARLAESLPRVVMPEKPKQDFDL